MKRQAKAGVGMGPQSEFSSPQILTYFYALSVSVRLRRHLCGGDHARP